MFLEILYSLITWFLVFSPVSKDSKIKSIISVFWILEDHTDLLWTPDSYCSGLRCIQYQLLSIYLKKSYSKSLLHFRRISVGRFSCWYISITSSSVQLKKLQMRSVSISLSAILSLIICPIWMCLKFSISSINFKN